MLQKWVKRYIKVLQQMNGIQNKATLHETDLKDCWKDYFRDHDMLKSRTGKNAIDINIQCQIITMKL